MRSIAFSPDQCFVLGDCHTDQTAIQKFIHFDFFPRHVMFIPGKASPFQAKLQKVKVSSFNCSEGRGTGRGNTRTKICNRRKSIKEGKRSVFFPPQPIPLPAQGPERTPRDGRATADHMSRVIPNFGCSRIKKKKKKDFLADIQQASPGVYPRCFLPHGLHGPGEGLERGREKDER
jgi:hypothetical protein